MTFRYSVCVGFGFWLVSTAAAACSGASDLCINEIQTFGSGSPTARRASQYVELRGPASTVIAPNTYLVSVDGDRNQNPGTVDIVFDLAGKTIGSNGYLVFLPQGNAFATAPGASVESSASSGFSGISGFSGNAGAVAFERPSTSFFIVTAAAAPIPGSDIDTAGNNDGAPDGATYAAWTIVDSIAIADSANDKTYAALNFRPGAGTTGTTVVLAGRTWYAGRYGDSFGSAASAWVASSSLGGGNPNYRLSATAVSPLGVAGKPLNHIGASNVWANAAPVHAFTANVSTNEDTALVLSTGNGNAISVNDSDAAGASLTQTLSVDTGSLTLATLAGISVDAGTNGSAAMTISGTLAALNTALNGLSYASPADFNGAATLSISTNDNGNTGTDGSKSDSDTITITVVAVNDVPAFTVGANQSVAADAGTQSVPGFATNLLAGPTDEAGQALDFIVSNDANGLFLTQPALAADGTLSYTPSASFTGLATVTVRIHDDGGTANGGVDTSAARTLTITTTTPTAPAIVSGITDNDADDLLPLNGIVLFDVNFSRNVDASSAALADFSFTGSGGATINSVTALDSDTLQVQATATAGGNIVLNLSGEILDTFAMAVTSPAIDDTTLLIDAVAPSLASVTRVTPSPTNAASVDFAVTFSESVSGIDVGDFNLAAVGVAGASISGVAGSGDTYTVSVATGTGDGSVALGLSATPVAQDVAGNALGTSPLAADYSVDRTAPLPVSITKLDSDNPVIPYVRFAVTFDEAVSGVDVSDFSLATTGVVDAMVIGVSGGSTNYTVDVYTGLAGGTIALTLLDDDSVTDLATNPLAAGLVGSAFYTIDAGALAPLFKNSFETAMP